MAKHWIQSATAKMKEKGTLGSFGKTTEKKVARAKKRRWQDGEEGCLCREHEEDFSGEKERLKNGKQLHHHRTIC